MKSSVLSKFVAVAAIMASLSAAHADTYNFYFSKPKKKDGEAKAVETPEPPKPDAVVETPKPPPGGAPPPVIINNYNNPARPDVGPAGPQAAAPATVIKSSVLYGQSTGSRWRIGFSGLYYPKKDVQDFWFASGSEVSDKAYGGAVSVGISLSPRVALAAYGGTVRTSSTMKTQYLFGMDAEFYPFSSYGGYQTGPVELGLLAGFTTGFFTDNKVVAIHAGPRLMLNLAKNFGITGSLRASFDYVMGEGGLLIRL